MDRRADQAAVIEPPITARDLRVKVFADGADLEAIRELAADPAIQGFTTNPTLMRKAGVTDYEEFAREALKLVGDRPISFEVFTDDFAEMAREARILAKLGGGVYVKIPVTDTLGNSSGELVSELSSEGIKLNVTGLFTQSQVETISNALATDTPACISLFAGRIADAGIDPVPLVAEAVRSIADKPRQELIWASPREILNLVQADEVGCHIITVTHDLLKKLPLLGTDLTEFSLDTVRMFNRDALTAGYRLGV
ncbi:MAG: transaldolase [Solirubrobacterales bacterium]|nr:transaldolase [Solirubrobacterales bacterium]